MPKMKTKSAVKKRFKITATGKVKGNVAFKSHNLRKRPQQMKRQARGSFVLADGDARIIKNFMPYG